MNIRLIFGAFLLAAACFPGYGQKIKYKELFVLLNAKEFEKAEPYLKKYLKDHDDNPNAYLFMGMIYQDKSTKLDVLKQTQQLVTQLDSAVYFYQKALAGLTEKEVSKNDEYYQYMNRRDVRTGEFGVKESDVRLDIETRIKLKDRAALIRALKEQLTASETYYNRAMKLFLEIQKAYPGTTEFYLRADEKLLSELRQVAMDYDSCHISFNDYKATSQSLGKTGYNQDLDPQEIMDFKKDGNTRIDFYHDDLKLWDYKRWALGSLEIIEKEINPMKDQLVSLDAEINNLHQKIKKDSVSVRESLPAVRGKISFPALRKVDPRPLPLQLFETKVAELEFASQIVEDRQLRDSTNVQLHLHAAESEFRLAQKTDSLSGILADINLEDASENYRHFVTTAYTTTSVLKSYISSTRDFAKRELALREQELKKWREANRWIIQGQDSIPLFRDVPVKSRYKPLLLQEEKYTAGLLFADSLATGYFSIILPSRKPDVNIRCTVNQKVFKKRNLPFSKAVATQDEKGLAYFVVYFLETKVGDKFPATIAKIYRKEGIAWSVNFGFNQLPEELIFSPETFELTVKTRSSIGEIFAVTFDKNGKVVN